MDERRKTNYFETSMTKKLDLTIRQLAEDFAAGVLAAIRGASLHALLTDAPARGAGARARSSERVPTKRRHQKPRATSALVGADELLDRMVDTAKKFPAGLRSEEFRSVLKLDYKNLFRRVATEAVATNLLRRAVEKRSTTYFPC